MSPLPRVLAIALLLAMHSGVWAGPVPAAETETATAPATVLPSTAPETAASGAAGSALAVEIITEAEASATAAEGPRGARRDNARPAAPPPAAPVRAGAPADDDPWGVRETGKAALQWVKDALPWLRSDDDTRDNGRAVPLDQTDWSASPLHGGANSRSAHPGAGAAAAATDPLTTVGYGETSQKPKHASAEPNVVRVVIDAIREVLDHPMTWLVLALIVIGAVVVKKVDRRPTE